MSDGVLATCCTIALQACLDVCAGVCLDLASVRHDCTQHLCACRCCACTRRGNVGGASEERDPLIEHTQPSRRAAMTIDSPQPV